MKNLIVIALACLVASCIIEGAVGLGFRNEFGGRDYGGRRFDDIGAGSGGRGFNSRGSGGRFDEGHRRDSFTSYTNSEHDSGHVSSGQGGRGISSGGGGGFGGARGGGSGFGRGRFGGRIGTGLYG